MVQTCIDEQIRADSAMRYFRSSKLEPRIQVNQRSKRFLDIVISSILIIITLPCLLLIAVAIKLESPGPILFVQQRRGANGSVFRIFKFRSMFTQLTDANCVTQCQSNDSRVTAVGAFIRRHGLDELPQLFNVLIGRMSIVGPRPHALGTNIDGHLLHEISDVYNARYVVKPGITGWAQINGSRGSLRTAEDLRGRIALDLYYIENWSIWLDIKIIAFTPARLIREARCVDVG
jgi:lipopolysaccharide/colanic/teichoic acid biosynthesis glycosyltransferase